MITVCALLCFFSAFPVLADVLIVADEFPAMNLLSAQLKSQEQVQSKVISQKDLPDSLKQFDTVIVYIHGTLSNSAERAFIDYTEAGGKLLLLHHSISSGKRKNEHWFPFLGVSLPEADVSKGGYKWIGDLTWDLVNLNTNHFIMTNREKRHGQTNQTSPTEALPDFTLDKSEVYLNHVLTGPRTLLMGFKYIDKASGTVYEQQTAGWIKRAGKGTIIYLMPGHTVQDFENPTYQRIVLNAVIYKP
jgi:hypothetical protein